jgi:hypothetical protein
MESMAKKLEKLPTQFEELGKALEGSDPPGWSIGSAEGGWVTPSKAEWGKRRKRKADTAPPSPQRAH